MTRPHHMEGTAMELKVIDIIKPDDVNVVLGQSHFIKTVEDVQEALVSAVPGIKFGFAFCEASGAIESVTPLTAGPG